jgi:hypothetical protein
VKKTIVILALLAILAVPAVFADWRVDVGITPPITAGLGSNSDYNIAFGYPWPLPTASISYQMSFGNFNLGGGLKAYTIIIATAAWPQIYAEYEMDPIILGLSAGGGVFGLFSPWGNTFKSGSVFLPELSVLFKLGKTFRLGVGGMSILGIDEISSEFPYIIYGIVKFTIPLGKETE